MHPRIVSGFQVCEYVSVLDVHSHHSSGVSVHDAHSQSSTCMSVLWGNYNTHVCVVCVYALCINIYKISKGFGLDHTTRQYCEQLRCGLTSIYGDSSCNLE